MAAIHSRLISRRHLYLWICATLFVSIQTGAQIQVINPEAVIPLAYFDFDEGTPDDPLGITRDRVSGQELTVRGDGQLYYGTYLPPALGVRTGSRYAIGFENNYMFSPHVTDATINFGIESWVVTVFTSGRKYILYNGTPGQNGWGIVLDDNFYHGLVGNLLVGSGRRTFNLYDHVALVCDDELWTLYVNGVASGSVVSSAVPPSGGFAVGASPVNPLASEILWGFLDEVRIFSFPPRQFHPSQLLRNTTFQSIEFNPLTPMQVGEAPIDLVAAASSGLPVHFTSSNPDVASITGARLSIHSAGRTSISARQIGNGQYVTAIPVERELVVNPRTIARPLLGTVRFVRAEGFTFAFFSDAGVRFDVFRSADAGATAEIWEYAGEAAEVADGTYRFSEPETTRPTQFYRVVSR